MSAPCVRVTIASADELAARDLVCWSAPGASGRKRLFVTDEDRAALACEKAPSADTRFLAQHATLERRIVDGSSALVDAQESPLAWRGRA